MITWSTIAILAATFAIFGAAFDRLILTRQKPALHQKLVSYWISLEELEYRNLAKSLSGYVLSKLKDTATLGIKSWKTLLVWTFVSYVLTSLASLVAWTIDGGFDQTTIPLPIFTTYISNWIFDLATVLITLKVLHIVRKRRPSIGLLALAADLLLAFILVVLCRSTTLWLNEVAFNYSLPGSGQSRVYTESLYKETLHNEISTNSFTEKAIINVKLKNSFFDNTKDSFYLFCCLQSESESAEIVTIKEKEKEISYQFSITRTSGILWTLTPATVFIPTALFIFTLIIFLCLKMILDFLKMIGLHLLEVATEVDPKVDPKGFSPGILVGLLLGCLAALSKAITELIKIFS